MKSSDSITRRGLLRGVAAASVTSLLIRGQSSPVTGTLVVNGNNAIGYLGQRFAGLSFEKDRLPVPGYFSTASTQLVNIFKQLGSANGLNTGVIRIGGDSADKLVYVGSNTPGTGQFGNQAILDLAAFLKATGWQCLYTINLAGDCNGSQNITLAAQEAAYVAGILGGSLYGFCLGNEPDEWSKPGAYWASYYGGNWSVSQYLALWNTYRSAILAPGGAPAVPIMGPDAAGYWPDLMRDFGSAGNGNLQQLTVHYYRDSGQNASVDTAAYLVSADTRLTGSALPGAMIAARNATPSGSTPIPFRLSECDSFYEDCVNVGVADGYGSALWCIDFLFNLAIGGACGANFHTPGGTKTGSYTPIVVNVPSGGAGASVTSVHPEFYGIMFFSLLQWGSLLETTLSIEGAPNVTAYAVNGNRGTMYIVIVNKTTTAYTLNMTVPSRVSASSYLLMTQLSPGATEPSLTATDGGIGIQGRSIDVSDETFTPGPRTPLIHGTNSISNVPVPELGALLLYVDYWGSRSRRPKDQIAFDDE
jgi:hypothetical protein